MTTPSCMQPLEFPVVILDISLPKAWRE